MERYVLILLLIASALLTIYAVRTKNRANHHCLDQARVSDLYWTILLVPWCYTVIQSLRIYFLSGNRSRRRCLQLEIAALTLVGAFTVALTALNATKIKGIRKAHHAILEMVTVTGFLFSCYLSTLLFLMMKKWREEQAHVKNISQAREKALLNLLKKCKSHITLDDETPQPECVICLEGPTDDYCQLPCQHQFHRKCIISYWNQTIPHVTCPLCRRPFILQ